MKMNLANKLTILRVIMIPIFLFFLMTSFIQTPINRYISAIIFVVAALTDTLDGYIARSKNMITNFGKFMDPLADKLLVSSAMIALVSLGELSAIAVIIIISREFIVTGFRLIAVEQGMVIAASFWGKVKTVIQMIMIVYLLFGLGGKYTTLMANILIWLSVIFTLISGVDYIYKNRHVLKG